MDDCVIEIPDTKFKDNKLFFLLRVEPGNLIGYYYYDGKRYEHERTPGHVRAVGPSDAVIPSAVVVDTGEASTASRPPAVATIETSDPKPSTVSNSKEIVYTWEYTGEHKKAHGTQSGVSGTVLVDDFLIQLPNKKFKSNKNFRLLRIEADILIGYYPFQQELYEHKRTSSHVRLLETSDAIIPSPPNRFIEQENNNNQRTRKRPARKQPARRVKKRKKQVPPVTEKEYHACIRGPYPEEELGLNSDNQKLIHMVRAFRLQDGGRNIPNSYKYEGRVMGEDSPEEIFTDWMNLNHMHRQWRVRTVLRYPGAWFLVPVNATLVPATRVHSSCTKTSVEKAFSYMGLSKQVRTLSNVNFLSNPFTQVKNQIRRMKGFKNEKKNSISFDPLRDAQPKRLYFIQIRSKHNLTGDIDNTHAICIFNRLIFDVNNKNPLRLSRTNLDRCCLGDLWFYDAAVRVEEFTPTASVARFIDKHLQLPIVVR